jgi:hypothetical protein
MVEEVEMNTLYACENCQKLAKEVERLTLELAALKAAGLQTVAAFRPAANKESKSWKDLDFMFRYLNKHAGELKANDRDWIIKLEDRFKENDELSDKETKIVSDIFKRY